MKLDIPNNDDLQARVEKLEKMLAEHQHLGDDGTKEFGGNSKIDCKELTITGSGEVKNLFDIPNLRIHDDGDISQERRTLSAGIGVSLKGTDKENDNMILQVGKGEINTESNREDWDRKNFAQVLLSHSPEDYPWYLFGTKDIATSAFLTAKRTPIIFGVGDVSGDTLTDSTAKFPIGQAPLSIAEAKGYSNGIIHGRCILKKYEPGTDNDFAIVEVNQIIQSTEKTIKCKYDFDNQGKYRYEILIPSNIGSANAPFGLAYFGDGIFLGYGGTNGRSTNNKVTTMTWGQGSPDGKVIASPGSLYLNQDGGASSTLYIKESGTGNTGWVSNAVSGITETSYNTLTNKRITPRVTTIVSNPTPTINTNNYDAVDITSLAEDITSMSTNLSGSPTNFQRLTIRILDNGSSRSITWGARFENAGYALPVATNANKLLTVFLQYNTTTVKWGCVYVCEEI